MRALTEQQNAAIDALLASEEKVVKLSGPAGSGKTTLIAKLQELTGAVVVTPTHKAACVLRSKGIAANTAHAVFFCCESPKEDIDIDAEAEGAVTPQTFKSLTEPKPLRFIANDQLEHYSDDRYRDDTLPEGKLTFADTIILDEASMLQAWMIQALARMSNKLILVGDERQLCPVNDKKYPRGLFNSIPATAVLTEVFRQTDDYLVNAIKMLETCKGHDKELWAGFTEVEKHRFADFFLAHNPKIICFTNATRCKVNALCRDVLGLGLHKAPQPGELMVAMKHLGGSVNNGFEGTVVAVTDRLVTINFGADTRTLPLSSLGGAYDFAYCYTVHKAQGSEWDVVLVINEAGVVKVVTEKCNKETEQDFKTAIANALYPDKAHLQADYDWWKAHFVHHHEASRRWAYTALTRGRQVFVTTSKVL